MPNLTNHIQTAFSAGELDPALWNRPDLSKFHTGAKSLRNCFVHIEGGASNRQGTRFVHDLGEPGLFVPFQYNNDQAYMLCFTESGVYFYTQGGVLLDEGEPYRIDSPYAYSDLEKLRHVQQFDTLLFAHPNYPEWKLTRFDHTDWRFEPTQAIGGPYLPLNEDRSQVVTFSVDGWDASTAYEEGDVVEVFYLMSFLLFLHLM